MAGALYTEAEEADRGSAQTEGGIPAFLGTASRTDSAVDQSNLERLDSILRYRRLKSVLWLHQRLGRKEDQETLNASKETAGLRLEEVE